MDSFSEASGAGVASATALFCSATSCLVGPVLASASLASAGRAVGNGTLAAVVASSGRVGGSGSDFAGGSAATVSCAG